MSKLLFALASSFVTTTCALAAPYTFTPDDYIEYGIYFAPRGDFRGKAHKLLELRFGNIEGYYAEYFPDFKDVPSRRQSLKLVTRRGAIRVNQNDSVGVTVTRDTWNEKKRTGTKRLEVRFENAQCTDTGGVTQPCVVDLLLTTDGADKGIVRQPRTLILTSSTGLSFRYRSILQTGGPIRDRAAQNRAAVINNYAWEWRPGLE